MAIPDFLSNLVKQIGTDIHRPSLFAVSLIPPVSLTGDMPNETLRVVKSVNLPMPTVVTEAVGTAGRIFNVPIHQEKWSDVKMEFIETADLKWCQFFEKWINLSLSPTSRVTDWVGFGTITSEQRQTENKKAYPVTLVPTAVDDMGFKSDSKDEYGICSVTFATIDRGNPA